MPRPKGLAGALYNSDGEIAPMALLFVEDSKVKATGSFREVLPNETSFCYVPE